MVLTVAPGPAEGSYGCLWTGLALESMLMFEAHAITIEHMHICSLCYLRDYVSYLGSMLLLRAMLGSVVVISNAAGSCADIHGQCYQGRP